MDDLVQLCVLGARPSLLLARAMKVCLVRYECIDLEKNRIVNSQRAKSRIL